MQAGFHPEPAPILAGFEAASATADAPVLTSASGSVLHMAVETIDLAPYADGTRDALAQLRAASELHVGYACSVTNGEGFHVKGKEFMLLLRCVDRAADAHRGNAAAALLPQVYVLRLNEWQGAMQRIMELGEILQLAHVDRVRRPAFPHVESVQTRGCEACCCGAESMLLMVQAMRGQELHPVSPHRFCTLAVPAGFWVAVNG